MRTVGASDIPDRLTCHSCGDEGPSEEFGLIQAKLRSQSGAEPLLDTAQCPGCSGVEIEHRLPHERPKIVYVMKCRNCGENKNTDNFEMGVIGPTGAQEVIVPKGMLEGDPKLRVTFGEMDYPICDACQEREDRELRPGGAQ